MNENTLTGEKHSTTTKKLLNEHEKRHLLLSWIDRDILTKLNRLYRMYNLRTGGDTKKTLYIDRSNENEWKIRRESNSSAEPEDKDMDFSAKTLKVEEDIYITLNARTNNTRKEIFSLLSITITPEEKEKYEKAVRQFIRENELYKPFSTPPKDKAELTAEEQRNNVTLKHKEAISRAHTQWKIGHDTITPILSFLNNKEQNQWKTEKQRETQETELKKLENNPLFRYPNLTTRLLTLNKIDDKTSATIKEKINFNKNCCYFLINTLYKKNKKYINDPSKFDTEWPFSKAGLEYIANTFVQASENFWRDTHGERKKVFHDSAHSAVFRKDKHGKAEIRSIEEYIDTLFYLSSDNLINPKYNDPEGMTERKRKRTEFFSYLYNWSELPANKEEEEIKEKQHTKLWEIRTKIINEYARDNDINFLKASDRFKLIPSQVRKIWGKTNEEIKDKSWLKCTFYNDCPNEEKYNIIANITNSFLNEEALRPLKIKEIEFVNKGLLTPEFEEKYKAMLSDNTTLPSITERKNNKSKHTSLEDLQQIYTTITNQELPIELQKAYEVCTNWTRGSNGSYKDCKIIVKYTLENKKKKNKKKNRKPLHLYQEIMFDHKNNEHGLGNHNFLDAEKNIFNRANNKRDEILWPTTSLKTIIEYVEKAVRDFSADIPKLEKADSDITRIDIENADGTEERISLKGLSETDELNKDDFYKIVAFVINSFIKQNKIIYFNNDLNISHQGLLTPKQLYENKEMKDVRFLTSHTLKTITKDPNLSQYSASIYTPEWSKTVKLNELWAILGLAAEYQRTEQEKNSEKRRQKLVKKQENSEKANIDTPEQPTTPPSTTP